MVSKSKKTILILSIALVAVVLAAVGTSYALFRYKIIDGDNFKVITGNLELSLSDNAPNSEIVINNLIPMEDETGMQQEGYTFTLTNTGSIDSFYTMYLDDIVPDGETKTRIDSSLIKVNITNNTTNESNTYRLSEMTERVLTSGTLDTSTNTTVSYTLRIWLDINADDSNQNKYFAAKVRVIGEQKNSKNSVKLVGSNIEFSSNDIIMNSANTGDITVTITPQTGYYISNVSCTNGYTITGLTTGTNATEAQTVTINDNDSNKSSICTFTTEVKILTFSELILVDNPIIKHITDPGTELKTIATTADQSGLFEMTTSTGFGGLGNTTYFFRGVVSNNVVEFAGFTWRIVRINEDGTVRLILDGSVNSNANYQFNSNYDNYTYIYYSNSGNYIKKSVNDWYTTNIDKYVNGSSGPKYSDYVASGDYFCEAAKVNTASFYQSGNASMTLLQNYTPALNCSKDGNNKQYVSGPIGLMTVDEIILAGGYYGDMNDAYYLSVNANGEANNLYWWTMSPTGYANHSSRYTASVWYVQISRLSTYPVDGSYNIRPVINIKSDVVATKNESNGHYIIQ